MQDNPQIYMVISGVFFCRPHCGPMLHDLCSTLLRGGISECPRASCLASATLGPTVCEGEAAAEGERRQSEDHLHLPPWNCSRCHPRCCCPGRPPVRNSIDSPHICFTHLGAWLRSSRFGSDCRLNKRVSWHFCHCRLLGPSSAESRY